MLLVPQVSIMSIEGVIGPEAHIYVYIGPLAQSKDIKTTQGQVNIFIMVVQGRIHLRLGKAEVRRCVPTSRAMSQTIPLIRIRRNRIKGGHEISRGKATITALNTLYLTL